jgi:hypothetical protein
MLITRYDQLGVKGRVFIPIVKNMKSFTLINMYNIHHGHKSYENNMIFLFFFTNIVKKLLIFY